MDEAFRERRGIGRRRGRWLPCATMRAPPVPLLPHPPSLPLFRPPAFPAPTAGSPPVPTGQAGRGKRFPRAMTPSYFSPTWRLRSLRGYCRSGCPSPEHCRAPAACSSGHTLRAHLLPQCPAGPQPVPREATQMAVSLSRGADSPVQQEPVRVIFVSSAPTLLPRPPPILQLKGYVFAGLALWILGSLLIPNAGKGSECFRCSPRVAESGVTAGHSRRACAACAARFLLLQSASEPVNHTSAFPLSAASKIVAQTRPAPQLPCKVIFSSPSANAA